MDREHELLPAAFYEVFTANLWKWMRVYDYAAAKQHADMWTDGLNEEEIKESVYPKVESELPASIRRHAGAFGPRTGLQFLQDLYPKARGPIVRSLLNHVLEMDAHGRGFKHAWPGNLTEKELPGISNWFAEAEDCRPGCLITKLRR